MIRLMSASSRIQERDYKDGTCHCYRFINLTIVDAGRRFTLLSLPMGKFTSQTEAVRKLLEFARGKIGIKRVYLDRGFFRVDTINLLDAMGIEYLMPAIKDQKIKETCDMMSAPSVIKGYRRGNEKKSAHFNLVILKAMEEEDKLVFATNMEIGKREGELAAWLLPLYSKRWGIETTHRVTKGLRAKTTSRNYVIRLFYHLFSVLLYNLWVIINLLIGVSLLAKVPEKPLIVASTFGTTFYMMFEVEIT